MLIFNDKAVPRTAFMSPIFGMTLELIVARPKPTATVTPRPTQANGDGLARPSIRQELTGATGLRPASHRTIGDSASSG